MKKQILLVFVLILVSFTSFPQDSNEEFKPSGKAHFKVFWNYHANFSLDAVQKSAFEIKRSYFGYKYNFSKTISSKITFDVDRNDAGSGYTAYLKIAQLVGQWTLMLN